MLEIGRHYKVSLPRGIKNHICTGCGAILVHGSNCSVRISSGNVIYKCGECGKTKRLYRAPT
jgi:RNase P subunit RPR2